MERTNGVRWLLIAALIGALAGGALVGTASAHETDSDAGYEFVFGGDDEPMVTGERMWLEFEVTDEETDEVVADVEDDFTITVHQEDGDETYESEVDARYGEEGWYEAPIVFTEPGQYVFVIEGEIDGEEVRVDFTGDHFQVEDHTELHFPADANPDDGDDAAANDDGAADDDGEETNAVGSGFGAGAAVVALGVLGSVLLARRR